MLVLKNKHNGETFQAEAPTRIYNTSYCDLSDTTWVYAFIASAVLFTLKGNANDETIDQVFWENWDAKSVVGDYDVGIIPNTNKGWFEHHKLGEEAGGGLWFNKDGVLEDYDGVSNLPEDVVKGIRELGYKVPDTICVDGYWNDSKEEFSYNAIIGENEEVNDDDIFYQFDSEDKVIGNHGDFTVISFNRIL